MNSQSVRPTDDEIEKIVKEYSNMLFKLCFTMLGNNADAEDAVSETFLKLITISPNFKGDEHKKAWLIRVSSNICRDMLRFKRKRMHLELDEIKEYCTVDRELEVLEEILRLPVKYKAVIYLFYIEGYKTDEIAKILSVSGSAVRKRLQYGRELLRLELRKE